MKKSIMMASLMMLAIPMMVLTPWKKGAFETNQYRNLFVEMGYKQADSPFLQTRYDTFLFRSLPLSKGCRLSPASSLPLK